MTVMTFADACDRYAFGAPINVAVSDLFFNHDNARARDEDGGWIEAELRQEAQMFLDTLAIIWEHDCSVEDLLADFFGRM
jgi:hypothetical protein